MSPSCRAWQGLSYSIAAACHQNAHFHADAWDFAAARRTSDEGLAASPTHTILVAFRCVLEYTLGEFEAGDSFRRRILSVQRSLPPGPFHAHIHAIATDLLRAYNLGNGLGNASATGVHVATLQAMIEDLDAHPYITLRARLLLALVAALIGDPHLARAAYRTLRDPPEHNLVRLYLVSRFMGLAAHCFGDHRRARRHLERALELARRVGDRPLQAWIRYELGQVLLAAGAGGLQMPSRQGELSLRQALA